MLLPMIAVFKGCVLGVHRLGVRRVRGMTGSWMHPRGAAMPPGGGQWGSESLLTAFYARGPVQAAPCARPHLRGLRLCCGFSNACQM